MKRKISTGKIRTLALIATAATAIAFTNGKNLASAGDSMVSIPSCLAEILSTKWNNSNLRDKLSEEGYKSGVCNLEGLDIELNLRNDKFYNIKTVDNIGDAVKQLSSKYGVSCLQSPAENDSGWMSVIKKGQNMVYTILIDSGLSHSDYVATLGYEEGRLLSMLIPNKKELAYNKFDNPDLIKSQVKDNEDFYLLCRGIALVNAEIDPKFVVVPGSNATKEKSNRMIDLVAVHYK